MKKYLLFIIMLSGYLPGVMAQGIADEKLSAFLFKKGDTFDFGDVPEGPEAAHIFEFVNSGKSPLIIDNASASCGCTVAEWTKEPVLPGKKGSIIVKYNTDGRVGAFDKEVFIKSNAKSVPGGGAVILHIKGLVKAKNPELPATGYN